MLLHELLILAALIIVITFTTVTLYALIALIIEVMTNININWTKAND